MSCFFFCFFVFFVFFVFSEDEGLAPQRPLLLNDLRKDILREGAGCLVSSVSLPK